MQNSAGIRVPETVVVTDASEIYRAHEKVPYPFFVKGVFYGATLATCLDEALSAHYKVVAQWGVPVILQARVSGEELNVVGVGDGEGGLLGAVPMKKMLITDKGKGWAGITVKDPSLLAVARDFEAGQALNWTDHLPARHFRPWLGRVLWDVLSPFLPRDGIEMELTMRREGAALVVEGASKRRDRKGRPVVRTRAELLRGVGPVRVEVTVRGKTRTAERVAADEDGWTSNGLGGER